MNVTTGELISNTISGGISAEPTDYADYDYGDFGLCQYSRHGARFLPPLYSLFFAVGLPGSALVLWVILFREKLRSMTDVCLLNLALADLLLVCSLPFLAHQARHQWAFGEAACRLVLGAYHVGLYCGIFFVTLMSVDRYLAVVSCVQALRGTRTRSVGAAVAAGVWLAGVLASFPDVGFLRVQEAPQGVGVNHTLLYCAPYYGGHHDHHAENGGYGYSRHFWSIFGLFKMNVVGLLLPMAVMGFCYVQIVRTLRSSRAVMASSSSSSDQAVRMVALVVAVFVCCWLPYNVASFFKALELLHVYISCESSRSIQLALQVTEALAYSHSCLNPVLYVFVEKKFLRHLRRLVERTTCWVKTLITQDNREPPATTAGSVGSQTTAVDETSTVV